LFAAVLMGHAYGSYMTVGLGESTANLLDTGEAWQWALLWNGLALALVFRPVYRHVELVFKLLLGLLTVAVLGTAAWVGPRPDAVLTGLVTVQIPEQHGAFGPLLIMVGMIGAVGGSLMNLVYPYFLEDKGWCQPVHRRVQTYDFLLGVVVMVVLNLAVWTLGAELLHPTGRTVEKLDDLPRLLSEVLGNAGRALFYLGIFAAIYTSLIGHALGLARLGAHGYLRWQAGSGELYADYRTHFMYRAITVWILVSPLVWTHPAMPDFVTLTLVVQSGQVILIPLLAGGLWWITASPRYIGTVHRNRLWENLVMGVLLLVALWAACQSVRSLWTVLFPGT
jgi:Mn2+/Fe2+ NRAMP family transporter